MVEVTPPGGPGVHWKALTEEPSGALASALDTLLGQDVWELPPRVSAPMPEPPRVSDPHHLSQIGGHALHKASQIIASCKSIGIEVVSKPEDIPRKK